MLCATESKGAQKGAHFLPKPTSFSVLPIVLKQNSWKVCFKIIGVQQRVLKSICGEHVAKKAKGIICQPIK